MTFNYLTPNSKLSHVTKTVKLVVIVSSFEIETRFIE